MKKTILLFALAAMFQCVMAQQVSVTTQGESSLLGTKKCVPGFTQCYGADNDAIYLRYADGSAMSVGKVYFGRFDKDLQLQAKQEFPSSKATPMAIFVNDGDVAMILRHQTNRQLNVTAQHYNKQSLQPQGEQLVLKSLDLSEKHMAHMEASVSADHQLVATLCLEQKPDSTVNAEVVLYDRQLRQQWQMESNFIGSDNASWNMMTGQLYGAYSSFFVSNGGQVVIASSRVGEDYNTLLSLIYMDGKDKRTFIVPTNTLGIRSAKVVKCDGNRLYITGNIETVYANNVLQPTQYTKELYMMVFNMATKKMESLDRYELTVNDCFVLRNRPGNTKMKKEAYNVFFNDAVCDDQGITITYTSIGVLVMRVDNQGKIQWVRTIRNGHDLSWDLACYTQVFSGAYGDKVMIVLNREEDNVERAVTKAATLLEPGKSDVVLSVYLFDPQGNVEEVNAPLPKKSAMVGKPLPLSDRSLLFLGATPKSAYWGTLK